MSDRISQIIQELVTEDPSLQPHEKELRQLLEKLIARQPNTQFDESFRIRLRNQLMHEIERDVKTPAIVKPVSWFMRFSYAGFGGLAVLLLVVLVQQTSILNVGRENAPLSSQIMGTEKKLALAPEITGLENNAFDAILESPDVIAPKQPAVTGFGGGLRANQVIANDFDSQILADRARQQGLLPQLDSEPLSAPAVESFLEADGLTEPIPVEPFDGPGTPGSPEYQYYQPYNFVYKGQPLDVPNNLMDVFKRVENTDMMDDLVVMFENSVIDLGPIMKLEDIRIDSISVYEDRPFGYWVIYNPYSQDFHFSPYWNQWQGASCTTVDCFNEQPEPLELSNSDLFRLANRFLQDYTIDIEGYAPPVMYIDPLYEPGLYEKNVETVVYPLLLNNTKVYEESGDVYGINVQIDLRFGKVSNMWNAQSLSFERSLYDTIGDQGIIIAAAEEGGVFSYDDNDPNGLSVELGTPELVYMKTWVYKTNGGDEFIVPAYRFPITSIPDGVTISDKAIMVPIVSEFLEFLRGDTFEPVL